MTQQAIPYLSVRDAASAIDFYRRAFGATELVRLTEPGGRIGHAELSIGEAMIMLADEYPELGILGPQTRGGGTASVALMVEDADATFARAVEAGATVLGPMQDEFYGERCGKLRDPFGHVWHVATRTEEVAPEEMQRRYEALLAGTGTGAGQGDT